ncbi:MAG: type II toxin-antitoxin system Phd/YefM family antitoxin [Anaerolineales bacterium]
MNQTVSATEARVHFGEIMRRAKSGPVIVERDGKADVVIISKQEYDQMVSATPKLDWWSMVEGLQAKLRVELAGRTLPDPAEMIRQGREERDEQLFNSLR